MNKENFINELKKLNISITEEQIKMLDIYADFLIEYNKHTNLTSLTELNEIYLKHFYDSLTIVKAIDFTKVNTLLDVGTGAGFPGMVLKILFPNIEVTLLDSNNKKIIFLQELSSKLELSNINFYHGRAEEHCLKYREHYDIVTARAVSNLTVLSELCLPLTKIGGYFIPLKGANTSEIQEATNAIKKLGGTIEEIINFSLPYENSQRNIIKIKKIANTLSIYPRRYDKIIKYPLK